MNRKPSARYWHNSQDQIEIVFCFFSDLDDLENFLWSNLIRYFSYFFLCEDSHSRWHRNRLNNPCNYLVEMNFVSVIFYENWSRGSACLLFLYTQIFILYSTNEDSWRSTGRENQREKERENSCFFFFDIISQREKKRLRLKLNVICSFLFFESDSSLERSKSRSSQISLINDWFRLKILMESLREFSDEVPSTSMINEYCKKLFVTISNRSNLSDEQQIIPSPFVQVLSSRNLTLNSLETLAECRKILYHLLTQSNHTYSINDDVLNPSKHSKSLLVFVILIGLVSLISVMGNLCLIKVLCSKRHHWNPTDRIVTCLALSTRTFSSSESSEENVFVRSI